MAADGMFREAGCEHNRSVDRPYHFERRDHAGMSGQPIPAVRAVLRYQESTLAQLFQQLGQYRQWNTTNIRTFLCAHSSACLLLAIGKMSESNPTVICLLSA